jgi:hypothetical protein
MERKGCGHLSQQRHEPLKGSLGSVILTNCREGICLLLSFRAHALSKERLRERRACFVEGWIKTKCMAQQRDG